VANDRQDRQDPSQPRTYQCVKLGDEWHLTQEQAAPPPILRGGAWTSCAKWADFKLGYERRRPTCPTCVRHAAVFEGDFKGLT